MYLFKHLFILRQPHYVSCAWVWKTACLFLNHSVIYKQENACVHAWIHTYSMGMSTLCTMLYCCKWHLPFFLHQAVAPPHWRDLISTSSFKLSWRHMESVFSWVWPSFIYSDLWVSCVAGLLIPEMVKSSLALWMHSTQVSMLLLPNAGTVQVPNIWTRLLWIILPRLFVGRSTCLFGGRGT